jgi:hypothetical protein
MTTPRLDKTAAHTQGVADAMRKEETARQGPRVPWRSLSLDGAERDVEAKGAGAFSDLEDLWSAVFATTAKNKELPAELASRLAQHFSDELADYIATFPEGTHVAVARSLILGMLWELMRYHTDAPSGTRSS